MEHFILKKENGQATIEFLLVLVVGLSFIVAIIQPNVQISSDSIEDVSNIAKIRVSADKLVNTIQYVSASGIGTKQTIQVIVPYSATLRCEDGNPNNNFIKMEYPLKSTGTFACSNDDDDEILNPDYVWKCTRKLSVGVAFSCSVNGAAGTQVTPGIYTTTVEKVQGVGSSEIEARFNVVQ